MRVVIAEDEVLLRQGLATLLRGSGHQVVGTAGDAPGLMAAVAEQRPDLLLTDIRMPPGLRDDGLRAAIALRRIQPGLPVMVLSQFVQRRYAYELLADDAAGVGYQLKHRVTDVDSFLADLDRVAAGGTSLDPEVVEVMLARADTAGDLLDRLTPRQREVLALLAEGHSNAAIATRLTISERAVVAHTSNIYTELGIREEEASHRRVLAVLRYLNT